MNHYKSPLTIYIVWHPSNPIGLKFAEELYNAFCRDTASPLSRGLSIPVYFRYLSTPGKHTPLEIDFAHSDRNAIFLLADEEMYADNSWTEYIQSLLNHVDAKNRIFPVALSEYAFAIDDTRLNKKQFINLTKIKGKSKETTFKKQLRELKSRILHDLCRLLLNIESVSNVDRQEVGPPVKLFVSHAKIDGEGLAIEFRDYVLSQTKLKTFFDVNDIADSEDFEEAIKGNLKNSAIVVFLSDQYSTREWCRIEVLVAKRNKSPLVVVYNLKSGEKRSFPYLGNVPTLIFKKKSFPKIIDLALFQVLNNLFYGEKIRKEVDLFKVDQNFSVYELENAPELFNYIDIKRLERDKPILVIYPDPPLGTEELRVLNDIDEDIQFITPALIFKNLDNGK